MLEKIENYDSAHEIDTRQGRILYESLEDQYQTDEIVDDLAQLPVVYKCLSRSDIHLKAKTKFIFTSSNNDNDDDQPRAFSIRYITIDPSLKPLLLYEYDANNPEGILFEVKHGKRSFFIRLFTLVYVLSSFLSIKRS